MKKRLLFVSVLLMQACSVNEFANERKVDPVAGARTRVAIAAEYIQKGQPDLALQQLQRALELNPKSAEAHNVMGVLLEKDDNFVEAEQSYRKALSLKADYPQARNNYGVLLFRLKRYKEAMEQLDMAAADLSYGRREVALEYVAKIALMLNDVPKAQTTYERLLRLSPPAIEPAFALADLAYQQKNYDEAERYFQRYVRNLAKEPFSPQALLLGIRLAQRHRDINTVASYELVLRTRYPQSAEYREYLKMQP